MAKQMCTIEPFKLTYTVENRYTGDKFEGLEDISTALGYAKLLMKLADKKSKHGYMLLGPSVVFFPSIYHMFNDHRDKGLNGWVDIKTYDGTRWKHFRYVVKDDVRPLVMYDNLGSIVDPKMLFGYNIKNKTYPKYDRTQREYHRELTDRGLCKRKSDGKKIKTNWATVETVDTFGEVSYSVGHSYFRSVCTKNEITQNLAHENEYGSEFVRGGRRGKSIPTSWDDISSSYWSCRRSWKHNSKRKKQWIPNN